MFQNRSLNNRTKKLQESALRLMYKDTTSSFNEFLEKRNTFTIHQRNIQKLEIEMYKIKHKVEPKLMLELFQETKHPYNLQNDHTFAVHNLKNMQYLTETLSLMGPKIWSLAPFNIKI